MPTAARQVLDGLFGLRPAPPGRWLFALRAAACMGAPILVGWWLGDTSAGLMASIGGFTALYGSGRPFINRAQQLAVIAVSFALAVSLGMLVAPVTWAVVAAVAAIAMIATWLSNALQVGPPGAYLFALACAVGTAMPAAHISAVTAALLVLAGGAFAWLFHMAGALFSFHGPERGAVTNSGKAVIAYVEAIGKPEENSARHRAAFLLHEAWSILVNLQPARSSVDGRIARLRTLNRELHLRFAEAMGAASRHQLPPRQLLEDVRTLVAQISDPQQLPGSAHDAVPLGRPSALSAMLESLQPGSNPMRVIVRVGVAVLIVGVTGASFHLEHAYWAVAATVLMLHQGFDWLRTLQRSIERLLGTWVGLLLAGAILIWHPQGLWLVLVVMALQFVIEMLVMRNYALATVFITGVALTIASGGHRVGDPSGYLLARGIDTLVGCAIALLVFRLIPPRATTQRIPEQLARTLKAVATTTSHLARGEVTTSEAKRNRRELQLASFALAHAFEDSVVASRVQRLAAERMWPVTAAVERLAYRTLSLCWGLESLGGEAARKAAVSMFGDDGASRIAETVDKLVNGLRANTEPATSGPLPEVLEAEFANLYVSLTKHASS